jgi:uncharacterized protein YegP (UPF0339 family)
MKLDLYRDSKKEWRWRITARNGRIVGSSSEGYKRKSKAIANLKRIKEAVTRYLVATDEETRALAGKWARVKVVNLTTQ